MKFNLDKQNFRIFGPDETASNRLEAVYEISGKEWMADVEDVDINLSANGRVVEVLSEHLCEGWLEGYLLTGRHGLFSCYEAFIHIIDSMVNQHAKWVKVSRNIPLRLAPRGALNSPERRDRSIHGRLKLRRLIQINANTAYTAHSRDEIGAL